MSHRHFIWVRNPSDADQCLGAYFTISDFGAGPHGHGETFDPGSDPEIDIVAVIDENEQPVSGADLSGIQASIIDRFDFSAAARDDREFGMALFQGVL